MPARALAPTGPVTGAVPTRAGTTPAAAGTAAAPTSARTPGWMAAPTTAGTAAATTAARGRAPTTHRPARLVRRPRADRPRSWARRPGPVGPPGATRPPRRPAVGPRPVRPQRAVRVAVAAAARRVAPQRPRRPSRPAREPAGLLAAARRAAGTRPGPRASRSGPADRWPTGPRARPRPHPRARGALGAAVTRCATRDPAAARGAPRPLRPARADRTSAARPGRRAGVARRRAGRLRPRGRALRGGRARPASLRRPRARAGPHPPDGSRPPSRAAPRRGVRRPAGRGAAGGAGVPPGLRPRTRRVPRPVQLLHALGLPRRDHRPRRVGARRAARAREVLGAPGPPHPARPLADRGRRGGAAGHAAGRCRAPLPRRRPRRARAGPELAVRARRRGLRPGAHRPLAGPAPVVAVAARAAHGPPAAPVRRAHEAHAGTVAGRGRRLRPAGGRQLRRGLVHRRPVGERRRGLLRHPHPGRRAAGGRRARLRGPEPTHAPGRRLPPRRRRPAVRHPGRPGGAAVAVVDDRPVQPQPVRRHHRRQRRPHRLGDLRRDPARTGVRPCSAARRCGGSGWSATPPTWCTGRCSCCSTRTAWASAGPCCSSCGWRPPSPPRRPSPTGSSDRCAGRGCRHPAWRWRSSWSSWSSGLPRSPCPSSLHGA